MEKKKIFVTGANGQLGRELKVLSAAYPSFDFVFLSKEDLPIQDAVRTLQFFETDRKSVV